MAAQVELAIYFMIWYLANKSTDIADLMPISIAVMYKETLLFCLLNS